MTRRQFLRLGAATATVMVAGKFVPYTFAAEKRWRVGLIGCGWYGKCDLFRLLQVAPVEVISLCDPDARLLTEAAEMVAARQRSRKTPRTYADYRELLRERDLDIVLVETPDHWHALPTIAALQAGAHVWVQKPVSVDVVEGEAMLAAACKYGRVVQVNTQRRSTPHLIEARDRVIREGRLGRIGHVDICCYWGMGRAGKAREIPPPPHLDYDLWTGPASLRPFTERTHPRGWRNFMEYGNGIVGDMCIHMLDMVRWMLDLGWPRRISSAGGILVERDATANTPDTQTAVFDYGDLQVVWNHRTWSDPPDPEYPWAAIFYGEKGTLKASVFKYEFFPREQKEPTLRGEPLFEYEKYPEDRTEKDLERHVASAIRRHWQDFLRAIETGSRPVADLEQGHISSASCILANLALELGRTLTWDAAAGRVVGDDEANRRLRRPYRAPWVHPEPNKV